MTTQYADEIQSAGQDIADAGSPITFTRSTVEYDENSGDAVPVIATASSSAIGVKPRFMDIQRYEAAANLTLLNPVTLMVAAFGLTFPPQSGDAFGWGPDTFTVRTVEPIAPDGFAILYRIVGSR